MTCHASRENREYRCGTGLRGNVRENSIAICCTDRIGATHDCMKVTVAEWLPRHKPLFLYYLKSEFPFPKACAVAGQGENLKVCLSSVRFFLAR